MYPQEFALLLGIAAASGDFAEQLLSIVKMILMSQHRAPLKPPQLHLHTPLMLVSVAVEMKAKGCAQIKALVVQSGDTVDQVSMSMAMSPQFSAIIPACMYLK